jgi:hypothetical protein
MIFSPKNCFNSLILIFRVLKSLYLREKNGGRPKLLSEVTRNIIYCQSESRLCTAKLLIKESKYESDLIARASTRSKGFSFKI